MDRTEDQAASAPQPQRHLSKLDLDALALATSTASADEDEAIKRLFDNPDFAEDPESPNLLTFLHGPRTAQGDEEAEWRKLEDSNEIRTSGPLAASRGATVRWDLSDSASAAASVESRLSTFSMHLAKCAYSIICIALLA